MATPVLVAVVSSFLVGNVFAGCFAPPAGVVSWWRGENNALDQVGTNNGALTGNTTYGAGPVGQGFVFDGSGDGVLVGNPASLQLQDFTIEAWVKRSSSSQASFDAGGGVVFGYGYGGYVLAMLDNGTLFLGRMGIDVVFSNSAITDTNLHHVAVTKVGTSVVFYLDGVANLVPPYNTSYTFGAQAAIGVRSDNLANSFLGSIDEVSVYNRPLSAGEVQAIYNASSSGKCVPVVPTCTPTPAGLVSWWRGEANALDQAGTNNGTLTGNTAYGAGRVGQGFVFDGSHDAVSLGNPASLQLQDFTIETWIKRASTTVASFDFNGGEIFGYGGGGYVLGMLDSGKPFLSRVEVDAVFANTTISDTNLHHLAVTKSGTNVVFYVDGVADLVPPYNTTFNFATPAAIGARGDTLANSFLGTIDEVSVYNRQLSAGEVQAIYSAGDSGKCPSGGSVPVITSQPATQTVTIGETATFNVTASGTAPLSYQWRLNSTNIDGAATDTLVLTNVQPVSAGVYSVIVSNLAGTATSSNATLTVNSLAGCVAPPAGLVGWWRGEANALDQAGTNNGTLTGNTTYGAGRVGQGFVFDGNHDGVSLGNPASLQLQDFTIETWIKRTSTNVASFNFNGGIVFGYGGGGYALALLDNGTPLLSRVEVDAVFANTTITDTNLHHLAVTKFGTNVVFYVDGVSFSVPPYNNTYNFATPAAIGARGDTLANSFLGTIDEVSVYNRQLSAGEIQAIYSAGDNGKCLSGGSVPLITSQPATQTVTIGETATFNVTALGTAPLSYQWRLNSTNISGATAESLVLTNVQPVSAGVYSVIVSNLAGTATSSNATLTVNSLAACVNPPSGLVGWWRGENNALDQLGANNGTLAGNTAYGAGRVSQAFLFDGSGDGVLVGNQPSLQLQDFTIEVWIKRASTTVASFDFNGGVIFGYGFGGYALGIQDNGILFVGRVGLDAVFSNLSITDTNLHHVAVTKVGTNVVFYLDGVANSVPPYNTSYTFGAQAAIGARGDNLANSFLGSVDEVAVYNRPLSAGEVQAIYGAGSSGKCPVDIPPSISSQPQTQTVQVGSTASFTVTASGTPTLGYQWTYNGTNIAGANTASLTLTNLSFSQAGNYAVVVTNVAGTLASSNAVLSVVFPPATVRLSGTNGPAGGIVSLPVVLVANGNENALGFSLSFNPSLLSYTNISLGSGATGATLLLNTSEIANGKLGIALALPADGVFAAGTQEVVRVDLRLGVVVNPTVATISFGDIPIVRELSDAPGNPLAANYSGASVGIAAAQFEGDLSPRPNGDRSLSISDWVLAGRFAARLDYPTNATEFQRADCAPRTALGDGLITITDWVQAGRYAAKLDPATVVGGPSEEAPAPAGAPQRQGAEPDGPIRQLIVADAMVLQGQAGSTKVRLEAMGDENALGFSLAFDPTVLNYTSASLGAGVGGAVFYINTNQSSLGRLGIALSLPTGGHFAPGTQEIVTVNFRAAAGATGDYPVALTQAPVPREVSDANAVALTTSYINGTVVVNPPPSLKIGRAGQNIVLSWPLWSTNFVLEQSGGGLPPLGTWTNLPVTVGVSNNESTVTLPLDDAVRYFRLHLP